MRREAPQFLVFMRREIDDEQMPAAAQHAARFGNHAVGFVREVQRLMDDDAVDAGVDDRQVQEVALEQVDGNRLPFELGARDPQHFRGCGRAR